MSSLAFTCLLSELRMKDFVVRYYRLHAMLHAKIQKINENKVGLFSN